MSRILPSLRPILDSVAHAAGFAISDAGPFGGEHQSSVDFLEYRASIGEQTLLIGIYELATERAVTAELWSPEMLARRAVVGGADEAALRRRTWHIGTAVDPEALAREVAAEVALWLEEVGRTGLPHE